MTAVRARYAARLGGRSRGGFTLMEVIVAMVLTGVLVTLLLQWLGTMGQLSQVGADRTDPARLVSFIETRFQSDAMAATGCDPQRADGPIATVGPDEVGFYIDENGDGHADRVTWVMSGEKLHRDIRIGGGNCEFATVVDRTTVAVGVRAADPFTPWSGGEAVPQSSTIDCTISDDACSFDAVQLRMIVEGGASDFPVPLDMMVALNRQASALPGR